MSTLADVKQALGSHDLDTYTGALAGYLERCPDAGQKWVEHLIFRWTLSHPEHAEFVATNLVDHQPGAEPLDTIRLRCAVMETLVATERFWGMFSDKAIEAGTYLRSTGVATPDDVPRDLADRVALAVAKVEEMDDEDVFYLLTHGAHWLVTGAKTREQIRALVETFKHEVTWVPHVRKRQRDDDQTQPGAKKLKPLS